MKWLFLSLCLCLFEIQVEAQNRPMSGDSSYNVLPLLINGNPPNLPANTTVNGIPIGGGGSGTVTSFSAGILSPLFTTSVANPTTTPALSFSLSNAAAHTFFANNTGSTWAPSFTSFVAGTDYWDTTVFAGGTTIGLVPQALGVPTCLRFLSENGVWECASGGSSGAAPQDAHYITTQAESGLTAEFSLATLADGLLKHTVTTGVSTPARAIPGTDYEVPVTGSKSITRTTNDFALTNDSTTPGNSKYYGTDSGGTRGYFSLPAGVTGGNPTASVGLATVNGSASTFLRSDGAPPLDVTISPNWSGAHSFTGGSIVVPTQASSDNSTKAASTAYVTTGISNAVAGVNPAVAVQAATTAAGDTSSFTYSNGVAGVGATLTGPTNNVAVTFDGYTFTTLGQRALVKNDTQSPSGAFNGVYYVTTLQGTLIKPVLTRALDYNQPSDINNTGAIPVINGTVNVSTSWLLTSAVNTVGTDPLTYIQFTLNPTTLLTTANISDTAYDVSVWNSVTTIAPSKNALRDYFVLFDSDGDGKVDVLDQGAGITNTNSSGVVQTALTAPSGTIVGTSDTQTLTNKRINPRVTTITSNATWSPNADTDDIYVITAQAADATTISNPSGTPVDGQKLIIDVTGTAARALTWSGSQWRASSDLALPTTTTTTKRMRLGFIYTTVGPKWDLVAKLDNF